MSSELVKANQPVTNHWPEAHEVADILAENKGFWRSCSGCHETNEGCPTGPWSIVLGCNLGHGCHECGGIGAVWDTTDYADMGDYLASEPAHIESLEAENARLRAALEVGQAFANQVRAVTYHLNGQAYSSTVSALNAFDATLSRRAREGGNNA